MSEEKDREKQPEGPEGAPEKPQQTASSDASNTGSGNAPSGTRGDAGVRADSRDVSDGPSPAARSAGRGGGPAHAERPARGGGPAHRGGPAHGGGPATHNREADFAARRRAAAELKGRERRRRKRVLLLILMLALIALLGFLYWFNQQKEVPLPTLEFAQAERVLPPEFLFFFDGSPNHRLARPTDVKVNPVNRLVYVTDTFHHRVSVFDRNGVFQFSFDSVGGGKNGGNKLKTPLYIAFDSKGNVWVTDREWQKIFVFTPDGKFIKEFVPKNVNRARWQPNAIAIDEKDRIYISEIEADHHIQVFNPDGTLIADFGRSGNPAKMSDQPLRFAFPNGIAIDSKLLFITDSTNRRLQVTTRDGKFIRIIESGGNPRGIALGYMDRLHVVDAAGHNVLVYDKQGHLLTQFGTVGADRGQFFYPNGIGTDGRRIYVADTWNHRIDVWAWRPVVITPPIARRVPAWSWLLLGLLLLPFFLRKPRNIATRDFIEKAIAEEKLNVVKKELKKLDVAEQVYRDFEDLTIQNIDMKDLLRIGTYKERYVDEVREIDPEISDENAHALAMARYRRRKKRLFTESEELRYVADEFKIKNFNFEEFLDFYGYAVREEEGGEHGES